MAIEKSGIKEFHLFAGIGGGIYGGKLLGHECCGGVEIDSFCQRVLKQRQQDKWLEKFPVYEDITLIDGAKFKGSFDVLCGGFPCQAFSHAAHGRNISEKNLWKYMLKFVKYSDAPIVFGENVVLKAIMKARDDMKAIGYRVAVCRLSCRDLGADHQRNRFWFLAVKDEERFRKLCGHMDTLPRFVTRCWAESPFRSEYPAPNDFRREQLRGIGNAQSPLVAATAFRLLVKRLRNKDYTSVVATKDDVKEIVEILPTWIRSTFGNIGGIHTPTTMANYHCASMMKHKSCVNFVNVFTRPDPINGEYLMGMPIGATSPHPMSIKQLELWKSKLF